MLEAIVVTLSTMLIHC